MKGGFDAIKQSNENLIQEIEMLAADKANSKN